MNAEHARQELRKHINSERAEKARRYFKTGKGEYGEGDQFIGITVPDVRLVARHHRALPFGDIKQLLHSSIHEERLLALVILVNQFKAADRTGDEKTTEKIFNLYTKEYKHINNWDLVDVSCRDIVGNYLFDKSASEKSFLEEWARSDHLWKKRIAIISTAYFIAHMQFDDTLKLARILLQDRHDLIHKAVGWMLREVGKKNQEVLMEFLDEHYPLMPRTMLRYAIEKLDVKRRQRYLRKPR